MTQILTFIFITFNIVVHYHQSSSFISNGLTKQEQSPKNSPSLVVTLAYSPLHISCFHFISTSYVLERTKEHHHVSRAQPTLHHWAHGFLIPLNSNFYTVQWNDRNTVLLLNVQRQCMSF